MDLQEHKKKFEEIVNKYDLANEEKAKDIATFVTKGDKISLEEFVIHFKMNEEDAKIFLSFILKGIEFKEQHIDKK